MSLDGSGEQAGHGPHHGGGRDPPPAWTGENPGQWRQVRRDVLLWAADTDLPPIKRGVRFFRQLGGRARLLADGLEDTRLMSTDGLQYVINHFDVIYKDTLEVEKELEGERALFQGQKTSEENFVAYIHRRLVEFARYESVLGEPLPAALKGKLLVRQARLTSSQAQQITTWLDGSRDMVSIQSALCRLDTDRDLLGVTTGGSKNYFVEPDDDQDDCGDAGDELGDLAEYYEDPQLDVGYDSEDENMLWIYAADLSAELEEADVEYQFSTFESILRAKQQAKKSRGWFTPTKWAEEHGGSKGQKGLRTPPKGSYSGKSAGKGKGKGKGKSKSSWSSGSGRFEQMRQERDMRRAQHGVLKVPSEQVMSRVRCWRCGQLGHTSRNCTSSSVNPKGQGKGQGGGKDGASTTPGPPVRPSFFVLPFDHANNHTGFNFAQWGDSNRTFFQMSANMGVIDTGAVNAVVGEERLDKQILPLLRQHGLQPVKLPYPPSLGGIGGETKTKDGVMLPVLIGQRPGLVSTIVVAGDVPLLLPSPLLASLDATIDYPTQTIRWAQNEASSPMVQLPSGHVACRIDEGWWDSFWEQVPGADRFKKSIAQSSISTPLRHVMFSEDEVLCSEQQCVDYEHAWMPTSSSALPRPVAQIVEENPQQYGPPTDRNATDPSSGTTDKCSSSGARRDRSFHPSRLQSGASLGAAGAKSAMVSGSGKPRSDDDRTEGACFDNACDGVATLISDSTGESCGGVFSPSPEGFDELVPTSQPGVPSQRSQAEGEQIAPM
eukprot:6480958-Amphidinium_carterae.1